MPAFCRASRAAPSAMSITLMSAGARCRVMMPVRWRIHSSEESIHWQTSSLVTITSGRYAPTPMMRVFSLQGGLLQAWERSCPSFQFCE